ncbi:MAG: hypothetical protein JSR21_14430 [Proteobacteria bacterium]|nr:hypothetical protein [Pseudomonadota bacterium]
MTGQRIFGVFAAALSLWACAAQPPPPAQRSSIEPGTVRSSVHGAVGSYVAVTGAR